MAFQDLRHYSKCFIKEFIELYQSQPSLWQMNNQNYRNRAKKAAAYQILINKCKEIEPNCDKETIVRKINSLRTCYRKEFRKVKRAQRSGELYKPRLWYYDLLSFLNDDPHLTGKQGDEDSYIYLEEDATNEVRKLYVFLSLIINNIF